MSSLSDIDGNRIEYYGQSKIDKEWLTDFIVSFLYYCVDMFHYNGSMQVSYSDLTFIEEGRDSRVMDMMQLVKKGIFDFEHSANGLDVIFTMTDYGIDYAERLCSLIEDPGEPLLIAGGPIPHFDIARYLEEDD